MKISENLKNASELIITYRKKSTQFDKVCSYLGIASDPKDVMFEDIQKVIAGIKSTLKPIQDQLTEANRQLAAANQEVENRDKNISRLKEELTNIERTSKDSIDAIQNLLTDAKIELAKTKTELDKAHAELGDALTKSKVIEADLEACKKNTKPQTEVNTGGINAIIDWFIRKFINRN